MIAEYQPLILGLGHKARRGKDTVAAYLAEHYGFTVIHFSDALYRECRAAHISFTGLSADGAGWHLLAINGDPIATLGDELEPSDSMYRQYELEDRIHRWREGLQQTREWGAWRYFFYRGMKEKDAELLQWWGTEYRRAFFGDDYWIRQTARVVNECCVQSYALEPYAPPRIAIADTRFPNEAEWIKGEGGAVWDIDRAEPLEETGRPADHPSEVALDGYDFDAVLSNEGTPEDLFAEVDERIQSLLIRQETV